MRFDDTGNIYVYSRVYHELHLGESFFGIQTRVLCGLNRSMSRFTNSPDSMI